MSVIRSCRTAFSIPFFHERQDWKRLFAASDNVFSDGRNLSFGIFICQDFLMQRMYIHTQRNAGTYAWRSHCCPSSRNPLLLCRPCDNPERFCPVGKWAFTHVLKIKTCKMMFIIDKNSNFAAVLSVSADIAADNTFIYNGTERSVAALWPQQVMPTAILYGGCVCRNVYAQASGSIPRTVQG